MNRKKFVQATLLGMGMAALPISNTRAAAPPPPVKQPPFLKPGDMIGITSPAGYVLRENIIPAATLMQQWGYKIRAGDTLGQRDFTFGGTDQQRRDDLQKMLDDPQIKAIMCARGGYGSVRIVDEINWEAFTKHPKWIIGFSDITVLHSHVQRNFGIATIHSKMCNSFPDVWDRADTLQKDTIESINRALTGMPMHYDAEAFNAFNRPGTANGLIVGGNLKTLESLAGSRSDINTDGKILFVEDTGEYLYSIDRMFWNLKRSGKLSQLAGLIVGGLKVKQDPLDEQFGKNIYDIVLDKVAGYKYPVCFDFPVGHQVNNYALRCGMPHRLVVNSQGATLDSI